MRRPQLFLYIILTIFLAAGAVAFVLQSVYAFRTAWELDYGEGIVLWQTANVTNWKKAFRPIEQYPHIVFHYPPLFHLTARAVAPFTSTLLQAGRLTSILSLAGTCLICALLTAWAVPRGRSRLAAFAGVFTAGTLVFATPIWWWGSCMRVDMLGIFLSVCGIALFVLARRKPSLAFLAFVFFVAAVYTKQTSVAAPVACFVAAFVESPRRALQLLVFSTVLGLAILAMLYSATDGLVLRHLITYNQNPYFPKEIFGKVKGHCMYLVGPLLFAGIFPLVLLLRRKNKFIRQVRIVLQRTAFERTVVVVAAYFWISAAIAAGTISKQGGSDNYFLEMDIVACLLTGLFVGWLGRRASFKPRLGLVVLQIFVLIILLFQSFPNWLTLRDKWNQYRYSPVAAPEVVNFIRSLPSDVYSEDMVILMQAGKEVPAEPAIISALAEDGKWDESGFVERIRNGEFSAVVIRWNMAENPQRFRAPIVRAVEERYYVINDFAPFKVYLPK